MEFGKYVVLSTAHIGCAAAERLNALAALQPEVQPLTIASTLCGWIVSTQSPAHKADIPDELHAILAFGRQHGCGYVLLDSDGAQAAELPVFPW